MFSSNRSRIVIVGAMLAAVVGVAVCGGSGHPTAAQAAPQVSTNTSPATISVSGHGMVEGTPDTATVTIGVNTHDPSAQTAMTKNASEAAALIAELKAKGVAAKDIQTTDLSVNPDYDLKGHVTGYGVSNTVTVKLRDLANAGKIIDAAAAKVGDDIRLQGVALSIDDPSKQLAAARAEAVKDALAQGQQLSSAAGVALGSIRQIDTTGSQVPQPQYSFGAGADQVLHNAAVPTPIEAGSQQLSVDVTVVFNIG